jgi:hypothetical protein
MTACNTDLAAKGKQSFLKACFSPSRAHPTYRPREGSSCHQFRRKKPSTSFEYRLKRPRNFGNVIAVGAAFHGYLHLELFPKQEFGTL